MKRVGETVGSMLQPAMPLTENLARQQLAGWWCVREEPDGPPLSEDGRSRTVVISDVHIGTNTKTCWYQKAVHEPFLAAVLDYIVAHADGVDQPVIKLVVLGDLFDFWTFRPTSDHRRSTTSSTQTRRSSGLMGSSRRQWMRCGGTSSTSAGITTSE